MSKIIPIINGDKSNIDIIEPNLPIISLQNNNNNLIPLVNEEKHNINIIESNLPTLSSPNNKDLVPVLDNNNDLILEMNGIGPMGPKGERGENGANGNGILRIEKTKTENLVDYYTIYFTNGDTFEYQITNGIVHYYDGDYEITPMPYTSQILPTTNLIMRNDINIQEIPYYEVSNLSGGITATIGDVN